MAASAAEIRRTNAFDVLRAIHALSAPTRKVIAEESGLSTATVSSIVAELIAAGVVRESGTTRRSVGRPTAQLSLNADHGFLLGVDVAETYVHVEAFDFALRPLSSTELALDPGQNEPRAVASRVAEAIGTDRRRQEPCPGSLVGIGVSVPGQVDQGGDTSVFAPNWGWHNVPFRALLRESVGSDLVLENPLKATTIAELWSGAGRNVEDFVVLNIGTGVGAGIALGGKVLRGRTNSAGEWGHTVVSIGGRECRCGSSGCVETYVGAPGIVQTLRDIAPGSPMLDGLDQTAVLRAIRAGLDREDPGAVEVLNATAAVLGAGIANVVNLLNPELVVLGGWVVGVLGERLLDAARPHVGRHALATAARVARLDVQRIAGNPVSLGAAAIALENYLDSAGESTAWAPPELSLAAEL